MMIFSIGKLVVCAAYYNFSSGTHLRILKTPTTTLLTIFFSEVSCNYLRTSFQQTLILLNESNKDMTTEDMMTYSAKASVILNSK